MGVRDRTVFLFTILACAACHGGQPGSSFVDASVLTSSSDAEAAHDDLLRADIGRADSVVRLGLPVGLTSTFTEDAIFLRGGLPILRGREAARAVAAAESVATNTAVRWQPVRAEVSKDRMSGYSYGFAIYGVTQGPPAIRVDRYIAFWRKEPNGWHIAAYAETYGTPPAAMALPAEAVAGIVADAPMSRTRNSIEAIREADEAFSRDASKLGAGDAFGRYAAADAQIFSAPGEFITGPGPISDSFGPASQHSSLVWHPVDGQLAQSGDLGFTVGNAVFTAARDDGAPIVRYSKYLTVWKRQKDGSWRYVVDGGSARPAQK
jgi:ketosteroid isomerase-like protein